MLLLHSWCQHFLYLMEPPTEDRRWPSFRICAWLEVFFHMWGLTLVLPPATPPLSFAHSQTPDFGPKVSLFGVWSLNSTGKEEATFWQNSVIWKDVKAGCWLCRHFKQLRLLSKIHVWGEPRRNDMVAVESSDSDTSTGSQLEEEMEETKAPLEATSLASRCSSESSAFSTSTSASAQPPPASLSTTDFSSSSGGPMFWIIYALSALLMLILIILVNVNVFLTLLGIGLLLGSLIKAASCWRTGPGRRRDEYASI